MNNFRAIIPHIGIPDSAIGKPVATMACCFKTLISDEFAHGLKEIETCCHAVVKRMLANRSGLIDSPASGKLEMIKL